MSGERTQSGIPLQRFYGPREVQDLRYDGDLNEPGSFPFTRGRSGADQRGSTWIQRELSGEGDPVRSNEQLKYLISKGQTGIDVIGDSPTMACLDPDHPLCAKAVGTQGVSLCCEEDYLRLFQGIDLGSVTVSGSLPSAFGIAGFYLAAKHHGCDPSRLRGSMVQAPFYCEDCGYAMHMPFDLRLRLTCDSIEFCTQEMPRFHSFLEDTYYISESGLDSVEEMALGLVEIRHVVRELLKKGIDIDSFAPRIAILLNCRMDFFEEIAKIRATRRLFARMMRDEFGARDPRSQAVVITCHTSGLSLTAQQPVNNIVRGAVEALALVLAGVQAIEISAFDEAYRTPSPESHLIALRTQQVIHLESNAGKVMDPLGGSYYVESLTNELERRVREMIERIEAMGDPALLSDKGWFRSVFENAMERYARQIREKELLKVGVNIHEIPDEEDTLLKDVAERKIPPCVDRIERIREMKGRRDQARIKDVLRGVLETGRARQENLMPPVIDAFEAGATMGEIAGVLRTAYDFPYDPLGLVEPPI